MSLLILSRCIALVCDVCCSWCSAYVTDAVVTSAGGQGNTPWTHHASEDILKGVLTTSIAKAHNVSTVQVQQCSSIPTPFKILLSAPV